MSLEFVNRELERGELEAAARRGGLLVVFGRRRVGKTRMLRHWLQARDGLYSQAIEAPVELQIQQIFEDLRGQLDTSLVPKSWAEVLEILTLQRRRWILCIDEFPYLTAVDPTLPSRLQKWIDHDLPRGSLVVLAGSSTRMMHDLFLHRAAPLYGRASKLLHVEPMDYRSFCAACHEPPRAIESFEKFACVGGVPKYWEFVERRQTPTDLAHALYFDFAPYMEQEPHRLLRDEGLSGQSALAILEAIGRGAERPSEIAARLNTPQTSLSRALQQLLDASLLQRELPFGESLRSTKRVLYRIGDPATRFWFRVYSSHRSLWRTLPASTKRTLIHEHAATVFEDHCRSLFAGSMRFWEPGVELDFVAPDPQRTGGLVVAEVKFTRLTVARRKRVATELAGKWSRCSLSRKYSAVRLEVLDASVLTG